MIQDLQFIALSYLTLEEILIFFGTDIVIREKFFKIHPPNLPTPYKAIENGELATLKYMLAPRNFLYVISKIIQSGNLKILKYAHEIAGVKYEDIYLYQAFKYKHADIIDYLIVSGCQPTGVPLSIVTSGDLEMFVLYYTRYGLRFSDWEMSKLKKIKKIRKYLREN